MKSKTIFFISITILLFLNTLFAFKNNDFKDPAYWQKIFIQKDTVPYPIVFVHGISSGLDKWQQTADILANGHTFNIRYEENNQILNTFDGIVPTGSNWVWNVTYYTPNVLNEIFTGTLNQYAIRLKKMITIIKRISGSDKVIIIAHSMGGLVARAMMGLDDTSWNSVYKILTVGTPNLGVATSVGIIGQFRDLYNKSEFISLLNKTWLEQIHSGYQGWGVIGALNLEKEAIQKTVYSGEMTDAGGPGFITINSAIPFGEWQDSVGNNLDKANLNTAHFGFRLATISNHEGLLFHEATFKGILWAIKK